MHAINVIKMFNLLQSIRHKIITNSNMNKFILFKMQIAWDCILSNSIDYSKPKLYYQNCVYILFSSIIKQNTFSFVRTRGK